MTRYAFPFCFVLACLVAHVSAQPSDPPLLLASNAPLPRTADGAVGLAYPDSSAGLTVWRFREAREVSPAVLFPEAFAALAASDSVAAALARMREEIDAVLADNGALREARDGLVATVAQRDQTIAARNQTIAAQQQQIQGLQTTVRNRDAQIAALTQASVTRIRELQEAHAAEVDSLQAIIDATIGTPGEVEAAVAAAVAAERAAFVAELDALTDRLRDRESP